MDETAFVYDRLEIKEQDSFLTRLKKVSLRCLYFCELNGTYIALYCLMLPGILMNVLSALFNEWAILASISCIDFKEVVSFHIYRKWGGRVTIE